MDIKIVIYEDNHDLRESLAVLLQGTNGFDVVGAFSNCKDVFHQIADLQPDVVLMDIAVPIKSGIEGA